MVVHKRLNSSPVHGVGKDKGKGSFYYPLCGEDNYSPYLEMTPKNELVTCERCKFFINNPDKIYCEGETE
jgi:hypothetical protein